MEEEILEIRSEKELLMKASEETMKKGNGPNWTTNIGSRNKLEGSLSKTFLHLGYSTGKIIKRWEQIETRELSTFIQDRVRSSGDRGGEVGEVAVKLDNEHTIEQNPTISLPTNGQKWSP